MKHKLWKIRAMKSLLWKKADDILVEVGGDDDKRETKADAFRLGVGDNDDERSYRSDLEEEAISTARVLLTLCWIGLPSAPGHFFSFSWPIASTISSSVGQMFRSWTMGYWRSCSIIFGSVVEGLLRSSEKCSRILVSIAALSVRSVSRSLLLSGAAFELRGPYISFIDA